MSKSKSKSNTRKNVTRGWKSAKPGYHQRTLMRKRCGRKCFLGPGKSYPVCTKNTCKVNPAGVYSALIRSSQYHRKKISQKARNMLRRLKK